VTSYLTNFMKNKKGFEDRYGHYDNWFNLANYIIHKFIEEGKDISKGSSDYNKGETLFIKCTYAAS